MNKLASLADAAKLAAFLAPGFGRRGYLLALYGSVLTHGQGRDIDLLAVPMRFGADFAGLQIEMENAGFAPQGKPYNGGMGTLARVYFNNHNGLIVDLQIREVIPK